ncbi:hypothetical protein BZG01_20150 [Labilibaculum manganireducens]|uniref:Inner membrane protein YgaP-like transmembrane domain-containing protein n=1 Tax=Labilibaculum manganireducens TaxID=1940525 RepID=A0A2N3HSG1_9BACT|nr:DUF2892 domain-containing protein [Labilibaculum manganireducens]PKQ60991.1 hypothetical protein BZG01_20150 [Labilibaculum manganireducens]
MKKNMGKTDRILRVIIALILATLYFTDVITGTIGIVVLVFAGIMFLTSLIGSCPPYGLFGINTCKIEEQKK